MSTVVTWCRDRSVVFGELAVDDLNQESSCNGSSVCGLDVVA